LGLLAATPSGVPAGRPSDGGKSTDHHLDATPVATSGGATTVVEILAPLYDDHANVAYPRSTLDGSAGQPGDRHLLNIEFV
jgi:hypothetical protein